MQSLSHQLPSLRSFPPLEILSQSSPSHRQHIEIQIIAQWQHRLRHSTGEKHLHRRIAHWPVRQGIDDPWNELICFLPIPHRRPLQSCRVRDRRKMQNQICRAPKSRVHNHGIVQRFLGDYLLQGYSFSCQMHRRPSTPRRHVLPTLRSAWTERTVRQAHSQRFPHDLARGRCSQKLTAATRTRTSSTGRSRCFLQTHFAMGIARAQRLHFPQVLRVLTQQTHSARHQHSGQIPASRQSHHHGRQTFVASRHSHYTFRRRKGPHQATQHHRGIISKRK